MFLTENSVKPRKLRQIFCSHGGILTLHRNLLYDKKTSFCITSLAANSSLPVRLKATFAMYHIGQVLKSKRDEKKSRYHQ